MLALRRIALSGDHSSLLASRSAETPHPHETDAVRSTGSLADGDRSGNQVRAARLVRRYYTKTRAGHGDVEEALRFLNHASHILGNPARRAEYDADARRNRRAATRVTTLGGTFQAEIVAAGRDRARRLDLAARASARPARRRPQRRTPELSSQLADIRRTPAGQLERVDTDGGACCVAAWILVSAEGRRCRRWSASHVVDAAGGWRHRRRRFRHRSPAEPFDRGRCRRPRTH